MEAEETMAPLMVRGSPGKEEKEEEEGGGGCRARNGGTPRE